MKPYSRREFLRRLASSSGGLAGSLFLQACAREGLLTPSPMPTLGNTQPVVASTTAPNPTSTSTLAAADVPTEVPALAPTPTSTPPGLVVVRNGEPAQLVERALAALGGIEQFVKPGANVIIKPNNCVSYHTYEYAATTNPWVVGSLVRLCLGAGAKKVSVMDFGFGGTQQEQYEISGIKAEVEAAGGEMAFMPGFKYKKVDVNGKQLKRTEIFEDILKTDVLINVPIAKHHSLAGRTMAIKNLMGVIRDRGAIHNNFHQSVADLATVIRPTLNILDGVRILMANGPTGGNLDDVKKIDTLVASTDIVAIDSYGATLFGETSMSLPYIAIAASLGLGTLDLSQIKIEEISLS